MSFLHRIRNKKLCQHPKTGKIVLIPKKRPIELSDTSQVPPKRTASASTSPIKELLLPVPRPSRPVPQPQLPPPTPRTHFTPIFPHNTQKRKSSMKNLILKRMSLMILPLHLMLGKNTMRQRPLIFPKMRFTPPVPPLLMTQLGLHNCCKGQPATMG